jgi:pilus assembly protein TadC
MARYSAIVALFALLGLALWVAYEQWVLQAVDIPVWGWVAILLGVGISILVGGGLMALMFYSSRMGYDEQAGDAERERRRL